MMATAGMGSHGALSGDPDSALFKTLLLGGTFMDDDEKLKTYMPISPWYPVLL